MVRLPPAVDPLGIVLAAAGRGDTLVVTPSVDLARLLGARLRRAGVPVALAPRDWAPAAAGTAVVIGARAAAWAPMPRLGAVVVLDEHDEALQEERAPTWHARDVAIERARRAGVPCVLVSPCPSLEALRWGRLLTTSRAEEREGWPVVEVVDRGRERALADLARDVGAAPPPAGGAAGGRRAQHQGAGEAAGLRGVLDVGPLRGVRGGR